MLEARLETHTSSVYTVYEASPYRLVPSAFPCSAEYLGVAMFVSSDPALSNPGDPVFFSACFGFAELGMGFCLRKIGKKMAG